MSSLPDDYVSLPAARKLDLLWQRVATAPYARDRLPVRPPSLLERRHLFKVGHNRGAFEHDGDEVAGGRDKLIHAHGTVAWVKLDITRPHPYTGLFATGGPALLRVSDAVGGPVFSPSHALKFPVDGRPSINVFANQMHHHAKRDYDVFARAYANSLPTPTTLDGRLVAHAFQRTARALGGTRLYSNYLPLHDAAGQNLDGTTAAQPVVPDRIELHPTGQLHTNAGGEPDWRLELADIEPGAVLFTVHLAGHIDEPAIECGALRLERRFVASRYGDRQLFFQHHIGPRR